MLSCDCETLEEYWDEILQRNETRRIDCSSFGKEISIRVRLKKSYSLAYRKTWKHVPARRPGTYPNRYFSVCQQNISRRRSSTKNSVKFGSSTLFGSTFEDCLTRKKVGTCLRKLAPWTASEGAWTKASPSNGSEYHQQFSKEVVVTLYTYTLEIDRTLEIPFSTSIRQRVNLETFIAPIYTLQLNHWM